MAKRSTGFAYFMTRVHTRRRLPGCSNAPPPQIEMKKTDFALFQASVAMPGFLSSRMSSSVDWTLVTDCSGIFISPTFDSQAVLDP
jgi:hypothetical protein